MKFLNGLLVLICCASAHASDFMQEIRSQAFEIQYNNSSERDEEEELFEFYSIEVGKLDSKTLEQNPELVYRKALAYYEVLETLESFSEAFEKLPEVQSDLQFVLDHAEKSSRLFKVAQIKHAFIDMLLKASIADPSEIGPLYREFNEEYLKQWATHSSLTGKALRDEVALNVKRDSVTAASFHDFLLMLQDNPDLTLGYVKPSKIQVVGVERNEEGQDVLFCKVKYKVNHMRCSMKMEL